MGDVEVGCEMVLANTSSNTDDPESQCHQPAAFAWVKNPVALVFQHLKNMEARKLLTWHQQGENGPSLPERRCG